MTDTPQQGPSELQMTYEAITALREQLATAQARAEAAELQLHGLQLNDAMLVTYKLHHQEELRDLQRQVQMLRKAGQGILDSSLAPSWPGDQKKIEALRQALADIATPEPPRGGEG